jgi:hypothetical protein
MKQIFTRGDKGSLSLFSIFIIFILLAASGLYLWMKYQSVKNPGGDIKDPWSYVTGIGDIIGGIQSKQLEQTNRSKELAGNTKTIADKNNIFSMDIPESWSLISNAGIKGGQLSKIVAQSTDFRSHIVSSDTVYDGGVQLTVSVMRGENKAFEAADGGHGDLFVQKEEVDFGPIKSILHAYRVSNSSKQQLLDAHAVYGGNTYLFQFAYNSDILHTGDAPFQFKEILASVKFLKAK